jgi:hypothetical protein
MACKKKTKHEKARQSSLLSLSPQSVLFETHKHSRKILFVYYIAGKEEKKKKIV